MANNIKFTIDNAPESIKSAIGISSTLSIYSNDQKGTIDNPTTKLINTVKDATDNNRDLSFDTTSNGGSITRLRIDDKIIFP
jgi:hypothetical protein